jgi:DNA-binding MarR family transcriptional regulator
MLHSQSAIQKTVKQQKPFRSKGAEAGFGILIVADRLRRSWAATVKRGGLTAQQYNILRILRGAGEQGLPIREVAARLIEKSPGVTRFIDHLEGRGFLKRSRSTRDRRTIFCTITPESLEVLRKLDRAVNAWDDRCFSSLRHKELTQLIVCIEKIILATDGTARSDRSEREAL